MIGSKFTGPILPFNLNDPTHISGYGKGGIYTSIDTLTDRDAIPIGKREHGMVVAVGNASTAGGVFDNYQLIIPNWYLLNSVDRLTSLADNNNWRKLVNITINGSSGTNFTLTTSNINEGTNFYYTDVRVNANSNVINGATAYSWGNHSTAGYQLALGYTPVNKAGDTGIGALSISNTTASTSSSSGALIVAGGVGIVGSLYGTSSNFTIYNLLDTTYKTALDLSAANTLRLGNGFTTLTSPVTLIQLTGGNTFISNRTVGSTLSLGVLGGNNNSQGVIITTDGNLTSATAIRNILTVNPSYVIGTSGVGTLKAVSVSPVLTLSSTANQVMTMVEINPGITNSLTNGSTLYGLRSRINTDTSGAITYNIYVDGTAPNYFAGNTVIGGSSSGATLDAPIHRVLDFDGVTYRTALDSSALNTLRLGNGFTTLTTPTSTLNFTGGNNVIANTGGQLTIQSSGNFNVLLQTFANANPSNGIYLVKNGNITATTNSHQIAQISGTFTQSGTGVGIQASLYINHTISQTSTGINQPVYGIYINPTISSPLSTQVIGLRSSVNNSTSGNTGYNLYIDGTAPNYLAGNTVIGGSSSGATLDAPIHRVLDFDGVTYKTALSSTTTNRLNIGIGYSTTYIAGNLLMADTGGTVRTLFDSPSVNAINFGSSFATILVPSSLIDISKNFAAAGSTNSYGIRTSATLTGTSGATGTSASFSAINTINQPSGALGDIYSFNASPSFTRIEAALKYVGYYSNVASFSTGGGTTYSGYHNGAASTFFNHKIQLGSGTGIADSNGVFVARIPTTVGSATNYFGINNSSATNDISIGAHSASGDTNVSISYFTKGTGTHKFTGNITVAGTTGIIQSPTIQILDFDGITYKNALTNSGTTNQLFVGSGFGTTSIPVGSNRFNFSNASFSYTNGVSIQAFSLVAAQITIPNGAVASTYAFQNASGFSYAFLSSGTITVGSSTADAASFVANNTINQTSGSTQISMFSAIPAALTNVSGRFVGYYSNISGAAPTGGGTAYAQYHAGTAPSLFSGTITSKGFADASSASAGNVGEVIESTISTFTNYTTTATYQNITSISLTAGDWDIYGFGTFNSNTATITAGANAIFNIATATASATGAIEGKTISYIPQAALLGTSIETCGSMRIRVSISSTTSYYLNTQSTFTLLNPQFSGTISARRIR